MTDERALYLVYLVGCLALVSRAILARRLRMGHAAKLAATWVAIFAGLFLLVAFRQEIAAKLSPESGSVAGGALRVPMAEDGHFWVRGTVNGHAARFLIDSGATTTALDRTFAREAGVDVDEHGFGVAIDTANGAVIARRAKIASLAIGPIARREFGAVTADEFGRTNVLGMDFLSSLTRWGVEGRDLVLQP